MQIIKNATSKKDTRAVITKIITFFQLKDFIFLSVPLLISRLSGRPRYNFSYSLATNDLEIE